jgi:uncharacterized protein YjbI with pentapeptide repeats
VHPGRSLRFLAMFLTAWGGLASKAWSANETDALADAKPISQQELAAAVKQGEPVIGRVIEGRDIVAVLGTYLSHARNCVPESGMLIQKSIIRGTIFVESKLVQDQSELTAEASGEGDTGEATASDGENNRPEQWISIPWSIVDSTLEDPVTLKSVGLACALDVRRSKFDGLVEITTTTLAGDFVAEASEFRSGLEIQRSDFKERLAFHHAKFANNFQCSAVRFEGKVDFGDVVFSRLAFFTGSRFMRQMDFRYTQFSMGGNFSGTTLGSGTSSGGPFYMADFGGTGNFRKARFNVLQFRRTLFRNGADFSHVNGKSLALRGVTISGRLALDGGATVSDVELEGWGGSMVVDGDTVFRAAKLENLKMRRMAFKKTVDLQGLSIRSKVIIEEVSFEGDLRFNDGLLPGTQDKNEAATEDKLSEAQATKDPAAKDPAAKDPAAKNPAAKDQPVDEKPEIKVHEITLGNGFYIDRDQFLEPRPWWSFWRDDNPRFLGVDERRGPDDPSLKELRRTWRDLKHAFELAKNIELQNYAEYRVRRLEEDGTKGVASIGPLASRLFWGYGVRPMRVLLWFAIMLSAFALVYWTQFSDLGVTSLERARRSLVFSARTAWEFKYGYDNSATPTFQVITLAQSVLAKLTLALLAYALTQTNPLLSELTKTLLP